LRGVKFEEGEDDMRGKHVFPCGANRDIAAWALDDVSHWLGYDKYEDYNDDSIKRPWKVRLLLRKAE